MGLTADIFSFGSRNRTKERKYWIWTLNSIFLMNLTTTYCDFENPPVPHTRVIIIVIMTIILIIIMKLLQPKTSEKPSEVGNPLIFMNYRELCSTWWCLLQWIFQVKGKFHSWLLEHTTQQLLQVSSWRFCSFNASALWFQFRHVLFSFLFSDVFVFRILRAVQRITYVL